MKIVVCAKFVPAATADRRFRPGDNTVDRASAHGLLSELDENAVEAELAVKEAGSGLDSATEVTVLTVGPEQAADAVRSSQPPPATSRTARADSPGTIVAGIHSC